MNEPNNILPGADGGVALPQPCSAKCQECGGTGIVGDEGPGRKNARHEWHPCDCPKGDEHRPRQIERFHPDWTDAEMDAISELAKDKEMSQKNIIRQAVRLYQSAALGGCTIAWPCLQQNAIALAPPTLDSDLPKDVPGG